MPRASLVVEASTIISRRENCRLCGEPNPERVWRLAPTPIGDAYIPTEGLGETQGVYPLELFLCRRCGHAQLLDVVSPEVLYGNFLYVTSISLGLVDHFHRYADDVLQHVHLAEGALAVDIGSNDGTLLRSFQERGLRVLGVDPAREISRKATLSGVETLAALFTAELARQITRERGPATIVTANNTFANVDDVADFAEGIRNLLAPDGVFVCETGYLADLIHEGLIDNIYHEHLGYFSVKPLDAFFRRHHLELINAQHVSTKGGSLRVIVQRAGGPRPVSPSVRHLIDAEIHRGIDRPDAFKELAARIDRVKDRLTGLLRDLKVHGKMLAGYGASVGVTTLLYYFGLGDSLDFLIDDNPAKHGRFSPGYHLPVLPPAVLYHRKPDYLLLLAWRYAEPIMKRHQAYLDHGGRFIIPLPELQVVGPRGEP
ncbi:MAG: methyltransferase domain-containing protein [Candidatus Omnitrophica bacterium]|nr:methyltransferase domain-containing protein [Candidatus Omnitrophota bacterium]